MSSAPTVPRPRRAGDLLLVFASGCLLLLAWSFAHGALDSWQWRIAASPWRRSLAHAGLLLADLAAAVAALRLALWTFYRPLVADGDAPALSVVIPAYNEGAMVARSIDSVAAADYPRDRLQIIVVDDGSRDDTWQHIEQAAQRHPQLVTALRFTANRGKRAALAAGFERARGAVLVTLDSDSVIEPGALRALAAPFADPSVGAVAGRVAVLNRHAGLIPRMLHVRYAVAFDFLRAAQSTYGAVYCCPGALAAYRAELVRRLLPSWLSQRFLGAACTIGEDRALTNDVLGAGYRTVYQRDAVVHTIAPSSYRGLCKMFLRWDRSYVREEFRLAARLPRMRTAAALIAALDLLVVNSGFVLGYAALALLPMQADAPILGALIIGIGLSASVNAVYFLRQELSLEFVFGIAFAYFSALAMFWILPYALLTVRARGWLTR